jgi:transposase-like protein
MMNNRGTAGSSPRVTRLSITARMNTAADLVERSVSETLTYYAFPDIHWQKIRTNNPLERIMREIRRRTRVVGVVSRIFRTFDQATASVCMSCG